MRPLSFHARSGLAGLGDAGLDAGLYGNPMCSGCRQNLGTIAADPNAFANAIGGMKWLAIGVAALFFLIVLGSRR